MHRLAIITTALVLGCLSLTSCFLRNGPQPSGTRTAGELTADPQPTNGASMSSPYLSPLTSESIPPGTPYLAPLSITQAAASELVDPRYLEAMPTDALTNTNQQSIATPTTRLYLPSVLQALKLQSLPDWTHIYYVDSSKGDDGKDCTQAQNPATPKKTIEQIMYCNPGPGDTVRLRGTFTETIYPSRSGLVLYEVQDIAQVDGAVVTFNSDIADVYPRIDYVTIYGSRRGNSGAFEILSITGNRVTVDTSYLPGGQFLPETALDPGDLQAAILRPVHFTAWDKKNPPVYTGIYGFYHAINQRVIMVSYLKSIAGNTTNPIWPAFEIDGGNSGNSDFQILDHLEVTNAESAIAIEANEFQSNYDIIQHNNLHNVGTPGHVSDEILYFGQAYRGDLHHDFVQIMYNKIGPHKKDASIVGDGMDIKPSAHNATIFGNEVVGIYPQGCDDAPIKIAGTNAFVANNYIHDINPEANRGCGISVVDDEPKDPNSGGSGAILINNIVADTKGVGIRVFDASGVQVLNNTVYNIFPEPNCNSRCMEQIMGIEVQNWQAPVENIVIKNNIVQKAHIGIGRYIESNDKYKVSIDSDYNLVFGTDYPFRGSITKNTHDLVLDPGFVDLQNHNFTLTVSSPALNSGIDLSSIFDIDNHDAANPALPGIIAPIIRIVEWDRGAYNH